MISQKNIRLSKDVVPVKYQLLLRPDLDGFTFDGEETITLDLKRPAKEITLHSVELEIEEVAFKGISADVSYNQKAETATLKFVQTLPKGQGKLEIKFKGILNDKLRGFYRSKYTLDGQEKYLVTTQFESTDARRAFPCFDEPSHKSVFEVSLIVPDGLEAISNTLPSKVWEHEAGWKVVQFSPTPKMSTYLLAFIVGEFEYIQTKTKRGVLVRVFVTPGRKKQAKFALDVAKRCIDFFESYYGIKYPLPVIDMIAIPDFSAGAMENWGAVTYRETALLIDPIRSSAANRQRVAIVVAHELAHQWFGNLVTMEWWTHLWLNEGFASYMEYLAVDQIFPEWQMWNQFLHEDFEVAMKLDGLASTHPIEVEVHHPQEISEIFDKVSYSKGASVIRMLAEYLGYKDFRDGLRLYLKTHKFSNASTEDLWRAFEKVSGKKVSKIMSNWTAKGGYPVIELKAGKSVELTQNRFFSSAISAKKNRDKTIWSIPLKVLADGKSKQYLIDKKTLKLPRSSSWLKVNFGEGSFVRVKYPQELLDQLKVVVEKKELSSLDRLGLIRDAFDLAEAGKVGTDVALDFLKSYKGEFDFTVWAEISLHMDQLDSLLYGQSYYPQFEQFAKGIYSQIAQRMGWQKKRSDGHTGSLLRILALENYGKYGDSETVRVAQRLFKEQGQGIDSELRAFVYRLVAKSGGNREHSTFLKFYKQETLMQEKDKLALALASFSDPKLLQKTLEFALSQDVRLQDSIFIILAVWENPVGRQLAWEFVNKNWPTFRERYGGGGHLLPRLLEGIDNFTSLKEAKDVESFFKKNPTPEAKRAIGQALEKVYSNSEWLNRDGKKIEAFLNQLKSV